MKRSAVPRALRQAQGLLLVLIAAAGCASAAVSAAPGARTEATTAADPKSESLPDSTVIARVEDKPITVFAFRDGYFATIAAFRTSTDSAGRVEFLDGLVNKEVMARVAREVNKPLSFEDRIELRSHTSSILANTLYLRTVEDSLRLDDAELRRVYRQFGFENRVRHILLPDLESADHVYRELQRGRITWSEAVREYSLAPTKDSDGEIGWVERLQVSGDAALKMFEAKPGGISPPARDADGYHIFQVIDQRRVQSPAFSVCRRIIESDLRTAQTPVLMGRFFARLRARSGAVYDSSEIRWALQRFREERFKTSRAGNPTLGDQIPAFLPEEERRVLGRIGERKLTLGEMITGYQSIPSIMRRDLLNLESLTNMMDAIFLQSEIVEYAREAGMEEDPAAVAQLEKVREKLLVQQLYRDSISVGISVTPDEQRKYYDEHQITYFEPPRVRYANLLRPTEASADSVLALLRSGVDAADIIRADSLTGWTIAHIGEVPFNQPGPLVRILFEDLRPPEATKVGPTPQGQYSVLQCLEYFDGRQKPYEEVEAEVDAAVRAGKEEKRLLAFIARHRSRFDIETHPELLMKIRMVDPALD